MPPGDGAETLLGAYLGKAYSPNAGRSSPEALRDPVGANLDRFQVVKGWLDADGTTQERVFDGAWAGNREPGADGKLPAIGTSVDAEKASVTNTIGSPDLAAVWVDPDFDPAQKDFYYARVIEIPTSRWSSSDAFRFGVPLPGGAPVATEERAHTSPIWYSPMG